MANELSEAAKQSALTSISKYLIEQTETYFAGKMESDTTRQLALGAAIAANTAIENATQSISWNDIDVRKFLADMFRVIGYGLDFGNKEAYVIPYRNPKTNRYDLQTPVSSDGLMKLARKYSVKKISDIKKIFVREGDQFSMSEGSDGTRWSYSPIMFNAKPVLGYVTIVVYEDGTCSIDITTKEDVEKRRKASKSPNSPAWTHWYDEMAMAKAVRKHLKKLSIDLPKDVDDDDDVPVLKDMGDIATPKIGLDYPTPEKASDPEKNQTDEAGKDASDEDIEKCIGTPFEVV